MTVLRCGCGYKIWSELWRKEPRDVLLFFDDLETSESYGESVTHCPRCGRKLERGTLKPERAAYSAGGDSLSLG